ncbi:MAG: endolytic transglycosylase MltG [Bacillota bacterium]
MLKRRTFTYFTLFILVMIFGMGYLYWNALLSPVEVGNEGEISVVIPDNANAARIGEILYKNGLVRGSGLVSFYARLNGLDQKLKPGRYQLSRAQSLPDIVQKLVEGPPDIMIFTVPEGFTLSQLTDLLERKGIAEKDVFKNLLASPRSYTHPFLKKIPSAVGLEGYLFPDTYHIGSSTKEAEIIGMLLDRFQTEIDRLDYEKKAAKMNLTLHQAVTIASMIEGEAAVDEERPIIASVIYNRLRIGMPLQIDATVQYALGGKPGKLYYKDLEIDSPYNTYRIPGLPPGPINSPGRASLTAAVNPARTNYLYYVAKPDGTHAFSTTLEEHNSNKRKYLQ